MGDDNRGNDAEEDATQIILAGLQEMTRKMDGLREEVDELRRENPRRSHTPRESRSRSRHSRSRSRHSRSRSRHSRSRSRTPRNRRASPSHCRHSRRRARSRTPRSRSRHGLPRSWASRMELDEEESPNYRSRPSFDASDEEDTPGSGTGPELCDVSEETHTFLTDCCTRSVPNEIRKRSRSRYPLPRVPATKCPNLDPFIKSEISSEVKSNDKDLAKVQSFLLDSLAPLSALLEAGDSWNAEEVRHATLTTVGLIGNANARLSRLRRDKVVASMNKALLPLTKEDEHFREAPPYLFGNGFAKRSKKFMDQVRALRTTLPAKTNQEGGKRSTYNWQRGSSSRGGYSGGSGYRYRRGGAPSQYRGRYRDRPMGNTKQDQK